MALDREKTFKTRSANGTRALAETIAEILTAPRLVILRGDLGAGKTTLVQGWVRALGGAEDATVTSPTFSLVHPYRVRGGIVYHIDLYRLETEREIATLGLEEMLAERDALLLVEWGERFPSVIAEADSEILIGHLQGDERSFRVRWQTL